MSRPENWERDFWEGWCCPVIRTSLGLLLALCLGAALTFACCLLARRAGHCSCPESGVGWCVCVEGACACGRSCGCAPTSRCNLVSRKP